MQQSLLLTEPGSHNVSLLRLGAGCTDPVILAIGAGGNGYYASGGGGGSGHVATVALDHMNSSFVQLFLSGKTHFWAQKEQVIIVLKFCSGWKSRKPHLQSGVS